MRLAYDIESTEIPQDGRLAHEVDRVHCMVAIDIDTAEVYRFRPHQIKEAVAFLAQAESTVCVAHNGIKFDLAVLSRLYPGFDMVYPKHVDTLVMARLLFPTIFDIDVRRGRGLNYGLPKKLYGSHSLKAWGYRLGILKGDFGESSDWNTYSEEMLGYCEQDVVVTVALFKMMEGKERYPKAMELEHKCAELMAHQERNGFTFDEKKAKELYIELVGIKLDIEVRLKEQFGTWYVSQGQMVPKRTINYKDKLKGNTIANAPFTKIKLIEFNPSSRQHITKILMEIGWQPKEFTASGLPKVDDEVLDSVTFPEASDIKTYLMLTKRLGQLHDGTQGWLKAIKKDGRIHGSVNTNGAITGRATHSHPNIAQVPSGGALYGGECRELFTVPKGWSLLGTDASGLELRCLGHAMHRYDRGAYSTVILHGDIHSANQKSAGLPTRDEAKTFIYAFLYGAGDELVGAIVGTTIEEFHELKDTSEFKKTRETMMRNEARVKGCHISKIKPPRGQRVIHVMKGKELKKKFLESLPALDNLIKDVKNEASTVGYLIGLDGRKLHVRSAHSALNVLLQSAGGIICKHWGVIIEEKLKALGYRHGWDGDYAFCAWVHDEYQIACRTPEIAEVVGRIAKEAIQEVEKIYDFSCPLDAEYSVGKNWKETH